MNKSDDRFKEGGQNFPEGKKKGTKSYFCPKTTE
jgi:hypothetical protein